MVDYTIVYDLCRLTPVSDSAPISWPNRHAIIPVSPMMAIIHGLANKLPDLILLFNALGSLVAVSETMDNSHH